MGWDPDVVPDPQDPETFLRSKLDWSEVGQGRHAVVLEAYRALAALRRSRPELTDPAFASVEARADDEATGSSRCAAHPPAAATRSATPPARCWWSTPATPRRSSRWARSARRRPVRHPGRRHAGRAPRCGSPHAGALVDLG